MAYEDAPQLVKNYLSYKSAIQGRSKLTVFQYYHDLRLFFRYLLQSRNPKKYKDEEFDNIPFSDVDDALILSVTRDDIYGFMMFANDERQNKACARARKMCSLRMFYKYLVSVVYLLKDSPVDNIDSPKIGKKLPKYLSLDEASALLDGIDGKNYERDFAIITLFLNCGLRLSELANINISDISKDFSTLQVTGKGNKERMIYLNDACVSAVQSYLKVRPKDAKPKYADALFISRNRNRLSTKTIQWLIYKHLDSAGLHDKSMSVHKLRHTAATLMYQHGNVDVRVLKDILGHENLSTTQIYTHVSDKQMQNAVMSNPLAHKKSAKKSVDTKIEKAKDTED